MHMKSIPRTGILILALLFAVQTTNAEGLPSQDHFWVIGFGSRHPVGIAWNNPEWSGMHTSIHIWIAYGAQSPIEMTLPLANLGLLVICVSVALAIF